MTEHEFYLGYARNYETQEHLCISWYGAVLVITRRVNSKARFEQTKYPAIGTC